MRQDPPFAVQIELVEGCTLSCEFCGINGIRDKPGNFKFMSRDMIALVGHRLVDARETGWNPRIEFAMHGEPSMHPQLIDCIKELREIVGQKPSMVLFSNGSGFLKRPQLIDELLEAGINTIGLDAYEHVNIVPRLIEFYKQLHSAEDKDDGYPIYRYPQQREHNLHSGRREGHRDIVIIQDISKATEGNHASLNTHCGGGMEPTGVLMQRCAKPFRELAIRWDGNVALCCNDFRGIYKCGNVYNATLEELWNNAFFVAARKTLYQGDRRFMPCQHCNAKSMRVGLLPDKMGRESLDPPTDYDRAVMAQAIAGEPYTHPIRRIWDVDNPTFPESMTEGHPLNVQDRKKRANRE